MSEIHFDARIAAIDAAAHDGMHAPDVVDPTVEFLAELAGNGAALEFGIGTGRIAIPLRARGISVYGLDLSLDMVAALRDRAGGIDIPVTIGDMATVRVEREFTLIYAVWNTFINLLSQDEQVQCFRNAAAHLVPGGYFVVETLVPRLEGLSLGETVRASAFGPNNADVDEYDVVAQRITSHHYWNDGGRWETWSSPCRYVWPSELDLMGRIAGLALDARWGGWLREPFTGESTSQVSVFSRSTNGGT